MTVKIRDRVVRGFVAGNLAAILIQTVNVFLRLVRPSILAVRFQDFSAVLLFGHKAQSLTEGLASWLGTQVWDGGWAVALALSLKFVGPRYYLVKGAIVGSFLWFCFYAGASLFGKTILIDTPGSVTLLNLFKSLAWGILSAFLIQYFEPHPSD